MPVHSKRITDTAARQIPPPPAGYALHWCPATPGFGVRVTAAGARAWIAERRVDGKTIRRTLGKADGRGAVSAEAARRAQLDVSSELQNGEDRLEAKRERRKQEAQESVTFADALRDYTRKKRRAKDGLPLKDRTIADYLAMIAPPTEKKQAGELNAIAARPIHKLTAPQLIDLHASLANRGERRQTYAMQVVRAVVRHNGVAILDNPLSPSTAGAKRVALAPSRGNPTPIPNERLAAWWKAACAVKSVSADQLRFLLLTGCRPGEVSGVPVKALDAALGTLSLTDTKNRLDHTVVLSKQALAIAVKHAKGKRPNALLFGVTDTGKTLASINAVAGVEDVTPHKLRHTFASIAAQLVPAFTLRKLLNHTGGGDTASVHYVHISDDQLRAGWQAVADFIVGAK